MNIINKFKDLKRLINIKMEELKIYDFFESSKAFLKNIIELESVVLQYLEITDIIIDITNKISHHLIIKENYEKINLFIRELNRLLLQYYIPYNISKTGELTEEIKINIINQLSENLNIKFEFKIENDELIMYINDNGDLSNDNIEKCGDKTFIYNKKVKLVNNDKLTGYIDLQINQRQLKIVSENSAVHEFEMYILNLEAMDQIRGIDYDQSDHLSNVVTIKEKLDNYKQYIIEKIDIVNKIKSSTMKQKDQHHSKMIELLY